MVILSGSSNIPLASKIASIMGLSLGGIELTEFKNGERRVFVHHEVKGQDIALIQSFSEPTDTNIIEFALITDALFRLGARRVFAVVPWFGYSLQDKVHRLGEPIAAKVIASMLCSQSVYRFLLMNLHNSSISGFFSVPSTELFSDQIFAEDIKKIDGDVVLVSSDFGGLKRVGQFVESTKLNLPTISIDKRRDLESGVVTARSVLGEARGKICIILDDLINGGSTAVESADVLIKNGAKEVRLYATHAILATDASERLQASPITEVVVSDTIDISKKVFPKLRVLSVASVFASELALWNQ